MGYIFSAGLLLALKGTIGGALVALDLGTLLQRPQDFAIRAGLTALALLLARVLERGVDRSLGRRLNQNLLLLAGRMIYIGTLIIGVIVILVIWGTGLVIPITLLGALSVALSLALQDILKNLVSGVYLLVERRFVIGDRITVSTYTGEVEDIQLRVTMLRTPDGQQALIPNSLLFTSPVVNLSA